MTLHHPGHSIMTDSKEDGAPKPGSAEAYVQAIMGYTSAFYGAAIAHGMKAGPVADAVAHIERAVIGLAALSASSPPVGGSGEVVVKPLEWKLHDTRWYAETEVGTYCVGPSMAADRPGWFWTRIGELAGVLPTADEAKAAAQADYEKRIRSALAAPVPNGVPEGVTVAWRWRSIQGGWNGDWHTETNYASVQWREPSRYEVQPLCVAASPVTPEGLSGGDGWIAWEGRRCPVPNGTMVDFKRRSGEVLIRVDNPDDFNWGRYSRPQPTDIVAWRLTNTV